MADEQPQKPKLNFFENFMLSGVAAVVSKTAAAPIDRVKLLVQNQGEMLKQNVLEKPYSGVLDCARRTLAKEGVLAFWRGNLANLVRYFPTKGLNFAFIDKVRSLLNVQGDASQPKKLAMNTLSGGVAGTLSLIFVYSLDFARTRLTNDLGSHHGSGGSRQFAGLIDVYGKTFKSDGFTGLYRGFGVSCIGVFIYYGMYFGLYDSLKPVLLGENVSLGRSFVLGWGVTATAGLVAYPFDTVRRRMMMTSGAAEKYKSSIDCAVKIIKNEGFGSMMRGADANILRGVAGANVLASFDYIKDIYVRWRLSE